MGHDIRPLYISVTPDCIFKLSTRANLLTFADPFAEADEDTGETKQSQNYIHIRIQRMVNPPKYLANIAPTKTAC